MPLELLNYDNLDEFVIFVEASHKDSAWDDYLFDVDLFRSNMQSQIGKDEYFTCIYRKESRIIGYFFASIGTFLFSNIPLGMENGIYIEPAHRGGRVAYTMYSQYIDWCGKMKAEPFVEIYFGSDEDNKKTYSFFTKVGMVECGRVFRRKRNGMY